MEFEGLLNGERRIDNPDLVEIYAGRPDLVQLSSPTPRHAPLVLWMTSAGSRSALHPDVQIHANRLLHHLSAASKLHCSRADVLVDPLRDDLQIQTSLHRMNAEC